jgi:hypothetical protein
MIDNSHQEKLFTDPRLLRRIKIGITLMVVVFCWQIFSGQADYWPITRWAMYARVGGIPSQIPELVLDATDSTGAVHRLGLENLGFLGRNVLQEAFGSRNSPKRDEYRVLLIDRVQEALPGVDIVTLEGWRLMFDVMPEAFPPIDRDHPSEHNSLGKFPVSFYTEPITSPDPDPDLLFGDGLALLAFRLTGPAEVRQCEEIYVRTWWQVIAPPSEDYHATLVLADTNGIGRAQSDSPLAYEMTSQWQSGQEQLDRRPLFVPCDLPAGSYDLLVGLYPLETVQNLEIFYPDGSPYGRLAYLTTVEVAEAAS